MRRFLVLLKGALGDLIFLGLLSWLLWKIWSLVVQAPSNLTEWLLVYLTGVYALLTLYLALVSAKSAMASERSAMAAERSAKAMEDSIDEARMARWAQFSTIIEPDNDQKYIENPDGSITLELLNPYKHPATNLVVAMWHTETGSGGEREVKFSSMMQSEQRNVSCDDETVIVALNDSRLPDSERRRHGEWALNLFKEKWEKTPQHTLCMVQYYDRVALFSPITFVYDLSAREAADEQAKPLPE